MAEQKQESGKENDRAAAAAANRPASKGLVESLVMSGRCRAMAAVWNAITADGHLEAAARQGAGRTWGRVESVPGVDPGAGAWHPLASDAREIAADRELSRHAASGGSRQPWPSEIAAANRHLPSKDHGNGHENGHDAGHSM